MNIREMAGELSKADNINSGKWGLVGGMLLEISKAQGINIDQAIDSIKTHVANIDKSNKRKRNFISFKQLSQVAAFCEDECRGKCCVEGCPIWLNPNGTWDEWVEAEVQIYKKGN